MAIRLNRAHLRRERLSLGWSQDQLAAISGVSVRTIQRLESGQQATPTSLAALAIALSLDEQQLKASDGPVRRVTPLTILDGMGPARRLYESLGLTIIETGDPGCIGVQAGATHLILCTVAFLRGDYIVADFTPLLGRTIPYLWVRSLQEARVADANVVEAVTTRNGTREALIEHGGQWAILAETVL